MFGSQKNDGQNLVGHKLDYSSSSYSSLSVTVPVPVTVVQTDNHKSNMSCPSCDFVVPDKRNALISSPLICKIQVPIYIYIYIYICFKP